MEYLKKEIFYPDTFTEQTERTMRESREAYFQYLEEKKNFFPKKLYQTFFKTNGFHDFALKEIRVTGDAWCYGKKSDAATLEVRFENEEYVLSFHNISRFKLLNELQDTCWHSDNDSYRTSPTMGLEEIVLCEIRVVGDEAFAFEFLTSSGAIFEIHFNAIKIEYRKIQY